MHYSVCLENTQLVIVVVKLFMAAYTSLINHLLMNLYTQPPWRRSHRSGNSYNNYVHVDNYFLFIAYTLHACMSSMYQQHAIILQTCNNFLAGDSLRSSRRFHALDETALFGCACKHEFPCLFLNLKHGERYNNIQLPAANMHAACMCVL